MDATYSQPLIEMGVSLTQLAIRGTATAVTNKIKTIKDEKSTEKIRSTYDEIVNELLSERDEAVRIAQSYKSELERIVISDEDIEHLHNTVSRLLDLIKQFSPGTPVEKARCKILCKRFSTKSRMALESRADSGLNPLITESHGGQSGMRAGTA